MRLSWHFLWKRKGSPPDIFERCACGDDERGDTGRGERQINGPWLLAWPCVPLVSSLHFPILYRICSPLPPLSLSPAALLLAVVCVCVCVHTTRLASSAIPIDCF